MNHCPLWSSCAPMKVSFHRAAFEFPLPSCSAHDSELIAIHLQRMPPKTILLMRHGEKPANRKNRHLTSAGRCRAIRLAHYIPKHFGDPAFIFAASPAHSLRPIETVRPLETATGLTVNSSYSAKDYK